MLVSTNKSKEKIKKYEELWSKIRDLSKSIIKNSDDYEEKYMNIKFNSDYELPLNKLIEIPSMIIVATDIFNENNEYYPQVFLDECLYRYKNVDKKINFKKLILKIACVIILMI